MMLTAKNLKQKLRKKRVYLLEKLDQHFLSFCNFASSIGWLLMAAYTKIFQILTYSL